MTLLQQQQDCGHDTTAAMARLCPWQDAMAAAKAGLRPQQDCSHGKTVAMALLQLQKDCSYGMTVAMTISAMAQLQHITTAAMVQLWPWQDSGYAAMASLQPWHDCGHGKTATTA